MVHLFRDGVSGKAFWRKGFSFFLQLGLPRGSEFTGWGIDGEGGEDNSMCRSGAQTGDRGGSWSVVGLDVSWEKRLWRQIHQVQLQRTRERGGGGRAGKGQERAGHVNW